MARKKERFADEIGDILERKGSGFWDASCLKVSSLGLEVLRVQWVGDDTNQAGTSYQHPNLGRVVPSAAPLGPKGSWPALETGMPPTIPSSAHGSPVLEFHTCPPKETFVFSLSAAKDTSTHFP